MAGIVGAGGNLGAVLAGFLFKAASLTHPQALLILGVIISCCSVLAFAVRFSENDEVAARREIEGRFSGRLTPAGAPAMGD